MDGLLKHNTQEKAKEEPYIRVTSNSFNPRRVSFSNRRFYTIALLVETGKLFYADKWVMIDRPALIFAGPLMPYAWESISNERGTGIHCLFNEAFLCPNTEVRQEPLVFLDYDNLQYLRGIFQKMLEEYLSDYRQKTDILRSYLNILMHEVRKIQQRELFETHQSASQRIVELFLNILDSQFPINDLRKHTLQLTTPAHYAEKLSIHPNHLNRVVKQVTGKTSRDIIASRIVHEALGLLYKSSGSISEIAFALGFEEPASFSNFIKKHTGMTPSQHRNDQNV